MLSWKIDQVTRDQILDKAACIPYSAKIVRKGINPTILSPATGKTVRKVGVFIPGMATGLGEIQTC